ncbi:nucleotide disphospho-sugar-binding domain-containing protein [Kitasatospora sp. NPDC058965]|uniref:nucleotide disphospho-sugar-binding domain-containing protein n=1 Tax=Kitasatospora sp. NPDC058965 TaxID=3346682 RepID=UPI0036B3C676
MTKVIVAATPVAGHTGPLLRIAGHLAAAGHDVVFLGGSRYGAGAQAAGVAFRALPTRADYDDRDLAAAFPAREAVPPGPDRVGWDLRHVFGDPTPDQFQALRTLLADFPATVVIHDKLFLGGTVLALSAPPGARPTVLGIGIAPLSVPSRDTAPPLLGLLPPVDAEQRAWYAVLGEQLAARSKPLTAYLRGCFAAAGVTLPHGPFSLVWTAAADRFLQLTVPGFEYPRSDLPANVSFIGPVPIPAGAAQQLPGWWPELLRAREAGRRVVVVTQGTVANTDVSALLAPTVRALAGREDVLLVAATARADGPRLLAAALPEVPANTRVAGFVPFDALLPHTDVLVTNGGYGGVQAALGHAVPLVVAGASEDKPEVAARVEWTGTGVNLRTDRPTVAALAAAVDQLLATPAFRERAAALAEEFARHDALGHLAELVATLPGPPRSGTAASAPRTARAAR